MSILLTALLLQAAAGTAPDTKSAETAQPPSAKLICKYIKVTGSRLDYQKVCATKRQWDVAEQETQEAIRDRQNKSTIATD